MEVARLVAEGLLDKEIAAILRLGAGTVKSYLDRIAAKIGAKTNRRVAITVWIERAEQEAVVHERRQLAETADEREADSALAPK
jgi:DNA-binding NarL/FixJ family response regulator